MKRLLLLAGTTEGRRLAEGLADADVSVLACVATAYGKSLLPQVENLRVRVGRLDADELAVLLHAEGIGCAVDATHPYAAQATANLAAACAREGVPCLRVTREASDTDGCVLVETMKAAAAFLAAQDGNALLTVGSKALDVFTTVPDYRERLYARVLPAADSLARCTALGFDGRHIIAMQGPFSARFNAALLLETGARWLVAKDSGAEGGFAQKRAGAGQADARMVVVGRPREKGYTVEEVLALLRGGDARCWRW